MDHKLPIVRIRILTRELRGRMGSPSGKSHDSSDSDSWSRPSALGEPLDNSPGPVRRKQTGETRLDRLVRRPSGEKKSISRNPSDGSIAPPSLPKPKKLTKGLTKKWPNTKQLNDTADKVVEEPLYDTVANDEPEDDYDNHLLYTTNKIHTDTVRYFNSVCDQGRLTKIE